MTVVQTGPAGWYPDPERVGGQRYWDGQAWTEHRVQTAPTVVAPAARSQGVLTKLLLLVALVLAGIIVVGIVAAIAIPVFLNQRHETSQTSYSAAIASQTKAGMQSLPAARQDRICTLFERNAGAVASSVAATDLKLAAANAPAEYADLLNTMGQARLRDLTEYGVTRGLNEFCSAR